METEPTILKLGGSVITNKRGGKPVVQTRRVERLAREIACRPHSPLILLYGVGSFGHPLAHHHRLSGRELSIDALTGAGRTMSAVQALGGALADIFLKEGVPVVPLQTSSFVRQHNGELIITHYSLIEDILSHGGVPLFGGDVIIADRRRTAIVSADALASELTRHFNGRRMLFATDVSGVYKQFPARVSERPLSVIPRNELHAMVASHAIKEEAHDVTGAMMGKLRSLLLLRDCTVTIFSGLIPGVLASVLHDGEIHGTRITL